MSHEEVPSRSDWENEYLLSGVAWDTNRPSAELQRVISDCRVQPCRTVEIGCGTGRNALWLAGQGFDVTAVDLSSVAIEKARAHARETRLLVNFIVADVRAPAVLSGQFDFFFDRGCYCAVHLAYGPEYWRVIELATRTGALGLVLMGNAAEPEEELGPSVFEERQVRTEWSQGFEILDLRPFRFEPRRDGEKCYLGWSCLSRRAA